MSVDSLKAQRKSAIGERKTLQKRHDELRKIVSSMDNKLDDDVKDINKQVDKCVSNLRESIKGYTKNGQVATKIEGIKEKSAVYEGKLKSCRDYITTEMQRCQSRINELNSNIAYYEQQIKDQGGTIHFWE